jgi:hypothetical protein
MTKQQLTLFAEVFPAKTCRFSDDVRALLESGAAYGSSLLELLTRLSQDGLLSKMSPVYYPQTTDEILPPSFNGWQNAGMAWCGGCLTLSISESPSDGVECSLSEVLETDVPRKYYLSHRAIHGVIRRSKTSHPLMDALKKIVS